VNTVMKLWVPLNVRKILSSLATNGFLRTQPLGVYYYVADMWVWSSSYSIYRLGYQCVYVSFHFAVWIHNQRLQ
jgi:hypothetical protein